MSSELPDHLSARADLEIVDLGVRSYREVWELQKQRQRRLPPVGAAEALFLCTHPPVITLGKSSKPDSLLVDRSRLNELGVEIFEVERGGDATYHGPGQIVLYPILNLTFRRRDVAWYMRSLEETAIRTLADFGIQGTRITGKTGVWTVQGNNAMQASPRKIASLGVRISRWCTMHGLSLNVKDCSDGFSLINPCGYKDIRITSCEEELTSEIPGGLSLIQDCLVRHFIEIFDLKFWRREHGSNEFSAGTGTAEITDGFTRSIRTE